MRHPASWMPKFIRTVDGAHLPTKMTFDMLHIPRATFTDSETATLRVGLMLCLNRPKFARDLQPG